MARNRRKLSTANRIRMAKSGAAGLVRRQWRLILGILCVVFITGALIEAAGILSATPHFTLAVVEVVGAERLDPDGVAETCGLVPGVTNTFAVDVSGVREDCLSDDRIAYAEVTRFLPDRIRVTIREARPVILVRTERDLVSFDSQGHPIFSLPPDWVPGLPVLIGLESLMVPVVLPAPPGEDREGMEARVESEKAANAKRMARVGDLVLKALELYATMESVDPTWLENGTTIAWNAASGYEMQMPGRPRLVFGRDSFMDKASRVNISLSAVAIRNADIEAVYLDNELEPGTVLLRERVGGTGVKTETAITRKVDFE